MMKITPSDISMIRCLHDDARMSIAQIAKQIGVPESTVRNRLAKLTESGILNFVAMTDPLKLGYQLWVMMEIQAELSKVTEVAQKLCEIPEVYFVALTTGGYDIVASASFRSNEDYLDFITRRLARIPGITRTANYNLLKIYKRQMNILPPTHELIENGSLNINPLYGTAALEPERGVRPEGQATQTSKERLTRKSRRQTGSAK